MGNFEYNLLLKLSKYLYDKHFSSTQFNRFFFFHSFPKYKVVWALEMMMENYTVCVKKKKKMTAGAIVLKYIKTD